MARWHRFFNCFYFGITGHANNRQVKRRDWRNKDGVVVHHSLTRLDGLIATACTLFSMSYRSTTRLGHYQRSPSKDRISTSMVERQNLTMRMSMRRFTRLTNGFSKKWENPNYMLAIYFPYDNFCRSHNTSDNATPAMAANLTKTIWSLKDLLHATKDVLAPLQD